MTPHYLKALKSSDSEMSLSTRSMLKLYGAQVILVLLCLVARAAPYHLRRNHGPTV